MNKVQLFFALMEVANANAAGFTVNAQTLEPVTKGYAVALADTQNSHNGYGLLKVIEFQQKHPEMVNAFGGWFDSESGKYYWDATVICEDLDTALMLGRRNNQLAIFDLNNMEEIRL